MKTIKFVAYLFYKYYSTGATKDIPYVSTLCAMVMLVGLHLFQGLIFFNAIDLVTAKYGNNKAGNFLSITLFLLPIFLIMMFLVKKSELIKAHYEDGKIRKGNVALVIYVIVSIMLIPIMMYFKNGSL